jgi:hypothetical protein
MAAPRACQSRCKTLGGIKAFFMEIKHRSDAFNSAMQRRRFLRDYVLPLISALLAAASSHIPAATKS